MRSKIEFVTPFLLIPLHRAHHPLMTAETPAQTVIRLHRELDDEYNQRTRNLFLTTWNALSEQDAQEVVRLCNADPSPGNMVLLGMCHQYGAGVPRNPNVAVDWYRRSADAGNADGMVHMGLCYRDGIGVRRNRNNAIEWQTVAAELNNSVAMVHLGDDCLMKCNRGSSDPAKACEWYAKATSLGNATAWYKLGLCAQRAKRTEEAVSYFEVGAQLGDAQALCTLGQLHEKGEDGVTLDVDRAIELYRESASLGYGGAMDRLGTCYAQGIGVEPDADLAIEWYTRALNSSGDFDSDLHLDQLLHTKGPDAYIRYYYEAFLSSKHEPKKAFFKDKIIEYVKQDKIIDLIGEWRGLEEQNKHYCTRLEALATENEALGAENERLRTELAYQPGGSGFHDAMHDFESRATSCLGKG